jgi:transcriptional regulator with XRE-family HTH domain
VASGRVTVEELGRAIAALRNERSGVSQEALAEAAGIDPSYLWGIEAGRRNPSWRVLTAIADALGVPVSEIVLRAEGRR